MSVTKARKLIQEALKEAAEEGGKKVAKKATAEVAEKAPKKAAAKAAKSVKVEELTLEDLTKEVDNWKKLNNVDDFAEKVDYVPTRKEAEIAKKNDSYTIEMPDSYLAAQKEKGQKLLQRAKELGDKNLAKDIKKELRLDPLQSRGTQEETKKVSKAVKATKETEAKPASEVSAPKFEEYLDEVRSYFKSGEKVPDNLRDRAVSANMAQLVDSIDAHNAGKNISEASGSRKEYRGGLTRKEAKTVRKFGRADEADEEVARGTKIGKEIDDKLAAEKSDRVTTLENLMREEKSPEKRAAYKTEYDALKKETAGSRRAQEELPKDSKEYADVKAIQELRKKNEELLFPETTAGKKYEEETGFAEPPLSTGQVSPARKLKYEDIPEVGLPKEEREALLAKRAAQKEKEEKDIAARAKEKEAADIRRASEEEGKELVSTPIEAEIPGYGKVKGERIETKVVPKKVEQSKLFSKSEGLGIPSAKSGSETRDTIQQNLDKVLKGSSLQDLDNQYDELNKQIANLSNDSKFSTVQSQIDKLQKQISSTDDGKVFVPLQEQVEKLNNNKDYAKIKTQISQLQKESEALQQRRFRVQELQQRLENFVDKEKNNTSTATRVIGPTEPVKVASENKTTVAKLKDKQPKKGKKEEKLEEVVTEEPTATAVAETKAAPAVDGDAPLKGKSLREVDAIVQANPKRKAEAVKYAKARNETRWSKWAEATESKTTSAEQNKFLAKLRNTAAERGDVPATAPVAAETPALPAPIPAAKGAPKPEIQEVAATSAAPTTEAFKGKSAKEVLDMATTDPKLRAEAIAYAKSKAESTGKTNWSRTAQLLEENTPKDAVGKKSLSAIQKTFKDTEELASQAEKPSTLGRNIGLTAGGLGLGSAVVSQKQLAEEKGQKAAVENLNNVIGDLTKTTEEQKDEEGTTEEPLTTEDKKATPMKREAQKAGAPVQFNVQSPEQLDKLATVTLEGGTEPSGKLAEAKDSLSAQLETAKQIYQQATKQAKTEAEQRETAILMGRLFEQAAQALIKYFAAKEGKRLGARIGSDLKFDKHDWSADLDRSMKKLDSELEAAKETYGIAIKRVESAERRQEQAAVREEAAKQRQENILLQDRLARERALEGQQARAIESEKDRAFREKENALNRQQSAENARLRLENSTRKLEESGKTKEADRISRLTGAAAEASSTFNSAYKSRKKMEESTQAKFSKALGDLALTKEESAEIADLLQNKPGDWPFTGGDEVNMAKAREIFYKAAERQAGQKTETSELQRIDNVIRKLESKKQRTPEEQNQLKALKEARRTLATGR